MSNVIATIFAAVMLAVPAAALAAEQTPEQFVREIYARYAGDPEKAPGVSIEDEASVKQWFAPDTAAMIIKDTKDAQTREDVPNLDFDPFVNGQDFDLKGAVDVKATAQTGDRATVVAKFTNADRKETLTYTLVKAGGQWRISDINWDGEGTLRETLQAPHPDPDQVDGEAEGNDEGGGNQ